jgi:hypothetical protein
MKVHVVAADNFTHLYMKIATLARSSLARCTKDWGRVTPAIWTLNLHSGRIRRCIIAAAKLGVFSKRFTIGSVFCGVPS